MEGQPEMIRVLFGLFVIVILTVGTVGVVKSSDDTSEVIEDNSVSTEVQINSTEYNTSLNE